MKSKRILSFVIMICMLLCCTYVFGSTHVYLVFSPSNPNDAAANTTLLQDFLEDNDQNIVTIQIAYGEYSLNSITIPSNVTLTFENGGRIKIPSNQTLTINGRITADRVQIFSGSGTICGNPRISAVFPEWFGVGAGGDDSQALQKAVDFATSKTDVDTVLAFGKKSLPVDLGGGTFSLSQGINAPTFVQIKGDNATLLPLEGFQSTDFAIDVTPLPGMPWPISSSVLIEGIQFGNFSNGIKVYTQNADRSSVIIRRCKFAKIGLNYYQNDSDLANPQYCTPTFEYGAAIFLDSQSSLNQISECVFNQCHRSLFIKKGDYVVLENSWISTRPIVQGQNVVALRYSTIVNKSGYLIVRDCLGVPGKRGDAANFNWNIMPTFTNNGVSDYYPGHPNPYKDPSIIYANQAENAWIANYDCVLVDNMRFGGEFGGFCAVNNFAVGNQAGANFVTIINSLLRSEFNEPTVRLFAVPNNITLRDNYGMTVYNFDQKNGNDGGLFTWNDQNYNFDFKLIEFAPSLTAQQITDAINVASWALDIKLDNNHSDPFVGRAWTQESLVPTQLQKYIISDLNAPLFPNN